MSDHFDKVIFASLFVGNKLADSGAIEPPAEARPNYVPPTTVNKAVKDSKKNEPKSTLNISGNPPLHPQQHSQSSG